MLTKTSKSHVAKLVGVVALVAVLCVGLFGCGSDSSSSSSTSGDASADLYDTSGGVASTVNSVEIGENAITSYVETFRKGQNLEEEADWANWMIDTGYESVEELRESVVDYYDYLELVQQAADKCDVTVSDSEVDEAYQATRDQYGSDEEWEQVLAENGTSDGLQRLVTKLQLLQEATMDKLDEDGELGDVEATDDDVLDYISVYGTDGAKRSSHILFDADDEQTAQEVLDKINSGELSFEDAAKEYSTDTSSAENGGDVGYDDMVTFVTEYQDALDNLGKDEISGLVNSDYGIHIIKCTDVIDLGDGDIASIDQISPDYVDAWREEVTSANEQNAFSDWMDNFEADSDIVINDMPENLPYYVDLSAYEENEEETEDEATDDSSSSSSSSDSSDSSDEATADEDSSASSSSDEESGDEESSASSSSSAADSTGTEESSASSSSATEDTGTEDSSSSSDDESGRFGGAREVS